MNIISTSEVNTGRQYALDYAKGLAIIYMIVCHTVMYFSSGYSDTLLYTIGNSILGGPSTAPFFMICVGVGICYSQRTSPHYLFKRGVMLLLGSYLLNLVRGGGFLLLFGSVLGWTENTLNVNFAAESFRAMMIVDILQFAGLAFLFFALAQKLKFRNWMYVVCAIVFQLGSHYFEQYRADNAYATALLGLFLPTGSINEEECLSCFPFFVWAVYPVVGYLFGQLLRRVSDLDRFYRWIFWPTLVLSCCYFAWMVVSHQMLPFSNLYYWHTLPEVFFYLCIDFCILSAFHLYSANLPQILFRPLTPLSRNITRVYCVSWCLILWSYMAIVVIIGAEGIHPIYSYGWAVLIIFASYYIQEWAKRWPFCHSAKHGQGLCSMPPNSSI